MQGQKEDVIETTVSEYVNETEVENKTSFMDKVFSFFKTDSESNETVEVLEETVEEANETIEESVVEEQEEAVVEEETVEDVVVEEELNESELNVTELNLENAKDSFLNFSAYKDYLIAMVSLLVLIALFATGFWKKILYFFDEDPAKAAKAAKSNGKKK